MWYHIVPTFVIIWASVAAPGYGLWWAHYMCNGNHFRRSLLDRWERSQYQRDIRLSGDAYKVNGLELIEPFVDPKAKKGKITPEKPKSK